jgi:hypothetical protein
MMLRELAQVLDRIPGDAPAASYSLTIVEENLLGKPTRSTRQRTAKRLAELYALDPGIPLFRLPRYYWSGGVEGRPMLAFLLAAARDPLLRDCTPDVQALDRDQLVTPEEIAGWLVAKFPGRFQPTTLHSTAQNLASSWAQAGYLRGITAKRRTRPSVTPVVVAYALLLGYLGGLRGQRLLDSTWTGLLERPPAALTDLAMEASKQGWLRYKMVGSVVEVTFPGLLTPAEERACREQD